MKKFLLSFLSSLVILFSFAPYFTIHAQNDSNPPSSWYNQSFVQWHDKVYNSTTSPANEIFGERYTAAQVQWVIYSLFSFILHSTANEDVLSCVMANAVDLSACAGAIQNLNTPSANPESQINILDQSLLSMIFAERPVSGIGYIKEKINKFDLVPEVQAQTIGFGFSALEPIQDMWAGSRNIAFGMFVLVSIIFSFMIMFRVKINPQTIITVQSAIPKIIIALILVTFSYAIAGLLIDFMYLVIGLLSLVLSSFSPLGEDPRSIFSFLTLGQPLGAVGLNIQIGILGFLGIVTFPFWIALLIFTLVLLAAGTTGVGIIFWIFFIPIIIVAIMIIWICVKTIWSLFKAFANIILLTIFGPLQITLGILIPNFGFTAWMRSYLSHLSVFVVTGVLAYLSTIFTVQGILMGFQDIPGGNGISQSILQTFFAGTVSAALGGILTNSSPWPPLLGAGNSVWIGMLFLGVAFVLFTMIPKASELIQSFLAGKPFAYGTAIGEAFGPLNYGYGAVTRSAAYRNFADYLGSRQAAGILESDLARRVTTSRVATVVGRSIGVDFDKGRSGIADKMRERGAGGAGGF